MALIATGSNTEFKPVPEGSHMGVCYRVVDCGTQRWEYQGEPQIGRKVMLFWELHGEADDGTQLTTEDGRPLSISKKYTLSLGKKANLRADLESWRGKAFTEAELAGFDIGTLLGAPCMVTVKHNQVKDKTYANVATVTRFPAALKDMRPKATNPLQIFDVNERDMKVFDTLPEWLTDIIKKSVEWSGTKPTTLAAAGAAAGKTANAVADMDDDIPFIVNELVCEVLPGKTRRLNRASF